MSSVDPIVLPSDLASDLARLGLFTPIYYVNGTPHLGHAYTMVAADAIARYARSRHVDVYFQTGTDEHGAKNAEKAHEQGKTPQAFVDEMSATFQEAWGKLHITHDTFWRTSSKEHIERAQQLFNQLQAAGVLYEAQYEGLYCTGCEAFKTEKDLDEQGRCPDHGTKPELVKESNWFFRLSAFTETIQHMIESDTFKIRPEHIRKEVLGLLKQDLPDFSISRQGVTWGVSIPFANDQVAYVWVEALMNYITALGYGSNEATSHEAASTDAPSGKEKRSYWPGVHIVGKDIIKFHCVFWPAMLIALDLPVPAAVFAHGFFTVDGQKMSKTRGNVIHPNDLVEQFGVDGARFLLLSQFPFGQDGDVKQSQFVQQYNAALANDLGNLVHRVTSMVQKYFQGELALSDTATADAATTKNEIARESYTNALQERVQSVIHTHVPHAFASLRPDEALQAYLEVIRLANQYIEHTKPWELAKQKKEQQLRRVLACLCTTLDDIAEGLAPFLPQASAEIQRRLGRELGEQTTYRVTVGDPLFPRRDEA